MSSSSFDDKLANRVEDASEQLDCVVRSIDEFQRVRPHASPWQKTYLAGWLIAARTIAFVLLVAGISRGRRHFRRGGGGVDEAPSTRLPLPNDSIFKRVHRVIQVSSMGASGGWGTPQTPRGPYGPWPQ
jgi:hypothetical protein